MNTRIFALVLAGTTSVFPALAQADKTTAPAPKAAPAATASAPATPPAAGKDVAADVNGEKIALSDLNRMMDSIKASDPSLQTNSPEAQKTLVGLRTQMLDELIATRLLSQEAKRQKIAAPAAAVDAAMSEIKKGFKPTQNFKVNSSKTAKIRTTCAVSSPTNSRFANWPNACRRM